MLVLRARVPAPARVSRVAVLKARPAGSMTKPRRALLARVTLLSVVRGAPRLRRAASMRRAPPGAPKAMSFLPLREVRLVAVP